VPTGGVGPRVQATTALCTGAYHLSKRPTQELLADRFGVELGLGTIAHLEQATTQAVAEARASVQTQPAAYADETDGREGRQRAWLGTVVTPWVTVFVVRPSRHGQVARDLLGQDFWGWLVKDRWSGYTWYPTWRRQLCWAHLWRDIEAMPTRGGRSAEIGAALRAQARHLCHWWPRVRDGTLTPPRFRTSMPPIRREVERLREGGQTCGVPKTEGTCRDLLKRRQALGTCVRHAGVEPTTNAAERAIRPGVLWRKESLGTPRPEGSRIGEAMLTVVATLKQQHRDVLDYLTAACEATRRGEPAPSLLPTLAENQQLLHPAA
jgi:transposase